MEIWKKKCFKSHLFKLTFGDVQQQAFTILTTKPAALVNFLRIVLEPVSTAASFITNMYIGSQRGSRDS